MSKRRVTSETRKHQIIAAADLILLEAGIDGFTIDQVIERAKIAKGTVYNYYKNKDEMLAELGFKALALMQALFEEKISKHKHSIEKIKAICKACYEYYQQYPAYFELIAYMERPEFTINMQGLIKLSQRFQQFTRQVVVDGQAKGEVNQKLDPQMVNYIIWAATVGVVQFVETKRKLLKNYHEIDTTAMIQTFATMITQGIQVK